MARNLTRAGHSVTVYNRTRARAAELEREGARVAGSPGEAAREAEAVISMLADDRAAEDVVFGADGVLEALPAGAVHVSSSTIGIALSRRLAAAHAGKGQGYVAAPVFGRPEAAEAARLWVVAAGPQELLDRCGPLFDAMGRGVSALPGDAWRANVVKVCGNFLIAAMLESLGEAFALARKSGVEARQFLDIANGALFNSAIYANYGATIADEAFEPAGFKLRLGLKDVGLALEAAGASAVPMPLASLLRDQFLTAIAHGQAEVDWSAVGAVAAEHAGLGRAAREA
jgi:3-hydroxyisobutyrate dehydrogenase-like beta-hydroxyacid dehydrogenase